eukprot:TRINITY_DN2107_c3_g1_i1.p1 TRINITY_DN2107_c3_g1~~TRINITY_DN2107_c3_g1_i1.p1  ORF type:complete len:553 (+),score=101.31 TRINITY_DN2107_c3_g1_i1:31-1659(+)
MSLDQFETEIEEAVFPGDDLEEEKQRKKYVKTAGSGFIVATIAVVVVCTLIGEYDKAVVVVDIPGLGKLRGCVSSGTNIFKGVPFAERPNRWEDAVAKQSWEDIKDATQQAQPCADGDGKGTEDCLYMNIYTPHISPSSPLPVLVFLHGGCYTYGTTDNYNGAQLAAKHNSIIAVPASRQGVFGFLSDGQNLTGWYGITDQIHALKWIQAHIPAFGGDPSRVTIAGQSSGAGAVAIHYTSGLSNGLFRSAIMQSGGFSSWATTTLTASKDQYAAVLAAVSCSDVACLKQQDVAKLASATSSSTCADGCTFSPPVDGVRLVASPHDVLKSGNHTPLPVLHGTCRHDGFPYANIVNTANAADWQEWVDSRFPNMTEGIHRPSDLNARLGNLYPFGDTVGHCNDVCTSAGNIETDASYFCPAYSASEILSSSVPVWQYVFTREDGEGAEHNCELPYFWPYAHNTNISWKHRQYQPADGTLADAMQEMWFSFVASSDPGPRWPSFNATRSVLKMNTPLAVSSNNPTYSSRCDLLSSGYFAQCLEPQ